jgi:hypothetical protein
VCFRIEISNARWRIVSPFVAAEAIAMRRMEVSKFGFAILVAAGTVMLAAPCGFAQTQDAQPSVADAARAAAAAKKDKDKNTAPAKTVITDDSLGSGAAVTPMTVAGASASGAKAGSTAGSGDTGGIANQASLDAAWARLQATEASLDRLEPLGKSEVATTVLGGNSADFPGRAEWEEKMYVAKTTYCARSRQLLMAMKEALLRMAEMNSGDQKLSSHDPQVLSLAKKTGQLMQLAQKTEAEFQSEISEGRALAAQSGK